MRAPLNLIFAIAASFLINGEMAWIFVGVTLFLGLVLAIITKIVYPLFTQVFEAYDNLNNSIKENITNMRVVKSYVKEKEETDKFKKASRRIYKMFMRAIRVVVMSNPAMMLSMYASFLMISWFGAHLIVIGKLSTGELTSMFSYTMTILISLMMFMMIFVMLSISMASVERINEVLNTESTIVSPENGLTEVADGSISFDHVDFSYTDENGDKTHVLKDITLDIKSGEVIGILGGTGSGKSSLVQLIPRLYDVEAGHVKVAGHDVKDYDLDSLRKQVAWCFKPTSFSQEPLRKICVGEINRRRMRKSLKLVRLLKQMNLSKSLKMAMTPRLNVVVPMSQADNVNVSVLHVPSS